MPASKEAGIRRQGRMALLIHELDLLPDNYRPEPEELIRARELLTVLAAAVRKWQPSGAAGAAAGECEECERLRTLLADRNADLAQARTDLEHAKAEANKTETDSKKPSKG